MVDILEMITNNLFLFITVMIVLFGLLIVLIFSIRKTNVQIPIYEEDLDEDELDEIDTGNIEIYEDDLVEDALDEIDTDEEEFYEEDLEAITDEEIIERIEQENEEEEKEIIENSSFTDIEALLSKMHEDRETRPEEVVARFEKEQEENSIISYQELVEMVKNNKTNIYDDEVAELPTTSSVRYDHNVMVTDTEETTVNSPTSEEVLALIKKVVNNSKKDVVETIDTEEVVDIDESQDLVLEISDSHDNRTESKFKPEEFISPVFGRMNPNIEYTTIPKFNKKKSAMNKVNLELGEKTLDLEKLDLEIQKHEEFLEALKDFRNSL